MTDPRPIKAVAGHVLATGEATPDEAARLAAYALGDAAPARTTRSLSDLKALAQRLEGVEGQTERLAAVRAEIERGTTGE